MSNNGMKDKSKSMIAKEYIKDNIKRRTKNEIIEYLKEKTSLKLNTLEVYYKEIKSETDIETRQKLRAKKEEEKRTIKFKGRKRNFFRIDDTKLYKDIKQKA